MEIKRPRLCVTGERKGGTISDAEPGGNMAASYALAANAHKANALSWLNDAHIAKELASLRQVAAYSGG